MKRKILTYPNDIEILSLKSQEVTDLKDETFKQLVQDLKDTLHGDPTGVGLSAIQIGVPLRVCIINYGKEIVMINPVITWRRSGSSGIKKFREGCLSDPGKYVEVERAQKVICQYTDENGDEAVDPDTYNCECFDAVLIPAVKEARLQYVTECLNTKKYNKTLKQRLHEEVEKAPKKAKSSSETEA